MNEMIERYIHDVTRRLPEAERAEVQRELAANINDMLPESASEQDVIKVLQSLGSPRLMAEQYRQNRRYLISPAMFDLYLSVLRVVVLVAAVFFACLGLLLAIPSGSLEEVISAAFSGLFDGALQAAFWVTLGFCLAEYYGVQQKPWTVDDLPQIPKASVAGVTISRSSTIVGMILTVFFTIFMIIMIVTNQWLLLLVRGSDVINPFSQVALYRIIPFLIIIGALSLFVSVLKLYWARWTWPLCLANILYDIVWISITISILHWPDLLSPEFNAFSRSLLSTVLDDPSLVQALQSTWVINGLSALFVVVGLIDCATSIVNTVKGSIGSAKSTLG